MFKRSVCAITVGVVGAALMLSGCGSDDSFDLVVGAYWMVTHSPGWQCDPTSIALTIEDQTGAIVALGNSSSVYLDDNGRCVYKFSIHVPSRPFYKIIEGTAPPLEITLEQAKAPWVWYRM